MWLVSDILSLGTHTLKLTCAVDLIASFAVCSPGPMQYHCNCSNKAFQRHPMPLVTTPHGYFAATATVELNIDTGGNPHGMWDTSAIMSSQVHLLSITGRCHLWLLITLLCSVLHDILTHTGHYIVASVSFSIFHHTIQYIVHYFHAYLPVFRVLHQILDQWSWCPSAWTTSQCLNIFGSWEEGRTEEDSSTCPITGRASCIIKYAANYEGPWFDERCGFIVL